MPNNKPLAFGGHALVWAGDWSQASARSAASSAQRAGYDYIEMLMIDPDSIDVAMTKDVQIGRAHV
jgi:D-psicose/D-tagatose/L-ribulose 3-epimerase